MAEGKRQQQEDLRSLRTWEFIGADDTKLWLLSEEQLRKQCRDSGLDVEGQAKDELVARSAPHPRVQQQARFGWLTLMLCVLSYDDVPAWCSTGRA